MKTELDPNIDDTLVAPAPPVRMSIALDPDEIVENSALHGLHWPVSHEEIIEVFECIMQGYSSLSKRYETEDPAIARILCLTISLIGNSEALSMYQAYAVYRRFRSDNIDLTPPKGSRIYKAFINNEPISKPGIINQLRKPPIGPSELGLMARSVRDFIYRKPVPFTYSRIFNSDKVPVLTGVNPLAFAHAHGIPERVVMGHRSTWFTTVAPQLEDRHRQLISSHPIVQQIGDVFRAAFLAGGEELPDRYIAYLCDLFVNMAAICESHIEKILANQRALPQVLWTGSGGNMWDRILRHAVKENGGSVIGHDHGPGAGYYSPMLKPFADYIACNKFITYTDAQVDGLARSFDDRFCPTSQIPKVLTLREIIAEGGGTAIDSPVVSPSIPKSKKTLSSSIQNKIMYLDFAYDGELTRPMPKPNIYASIKWQRRLFDKLKTLGYEVANKYHPECHYLPVTMKRLLNVPAIGGFVDEQIQCTDFLILMHPTSSAVSTILKSTKSIIYIDFNLVKLHADAREALEKRVAIVSGAIDEHNDLDIDWAELESALLRAPMLRDNTFLELYLGQ